jgi:phosphoribosylformimino-5-aminoimidazole carboxamide ribotide isomerase
MKIIPAIDLIDGACVRLQQGDYKQQITYSQDPLQIAKQYEASGIKHLHIVDLDGAKQKSIVNMDVVKQICSKTNLLVEFGGGISKTNDLTKLFDIGVHQVIIGSMAVKEKAKVKRWIHMFGPERIIIGADVSNHMITIDAWQSSTQQDILPFIKEFHQLGIKHFLCTDISKDGMLLGPAIELYREILTQISVKLIASGGVASMQDLQILSEIGCDACIIGKAIYENNITLNQLQAYVEKENNSLS